MEKEGARWPHRSSKPACPSWWGTEGSTPSLLRQFGFSVQQRRAYCKYLEIAIAQYRDSVYGDERCSEDVPTKRRSGTLRPLCSVQDSPACSSRACRVGLPRKFPSQPGTPAGRQGNVHPIKRAWSTIRPRRRSEAPTRAMPTRARPRAGSASRTRPNRRAARTRSSPGVECARSLRLSSSSPPRWTAERFPVLSDWEMYL